MSRVKTAFAIANKEKRAALIVYLTAGEPQKDTTKDYVLAAEAGGADVIELGVPFTDPTSDGPIIHAAMTRSLARGTTLESCLQTVAEVRAVGSFVPIVLFGYYHPIFCMGAEKFASAAQSVGVDDCLIVDLPLEYQNELTPALLEREIGRVPVIAPTTPSERFALTKMYRPSFVYYICRMGVTGSGGKQQATSSKIHDIRTQAEAPVAVGFGIRTPTDVAAMAALADGVVVGSVLVDKIAKGYSPKQLEVEVRALRDACGQ